MTRADIWRKREILKISGEKERHWRYLEKREIRADIWSKRETRADICRLKEKRAEKRRDKGGYLEKKRDIEDIWRKEK